MPSLTPSCHHHLASLLSSYNESTQILYRARVSTRPSISTGVCHFILYYAYHGLFISLPRFLFRFKAIIDCCLAIARYCGHRRWFQRHHGVTRRGFGHVTNTARAKCDAFGQNGRYHHDEVHFTASRTDIAMKNDTPHAAIITDGSRDSPHLIVLSTLSTKFAKIDATPTIDRTIKDSPGDHRC